MSYHWLILTLIAHSSFAQTAKTIPVKSPTQNGLDSKVGTSAVDALLNEDLIRSIRDPFQLPAILLTKKDTPKTDLEIFPLKDFKLNGVITGPKKTRAMITAPGNKVFFVKVGDRIGVREGHVSQILTDSVKVLEFYIDEHGKNIPDVYELKITGELNSLSRKEEE